MNKKPSLYIESGTYKRGDPLPEVNFDLLHNAYGKLELNPVVASSQQQLVDQIYNALSRSPTNETISYFYFRLDDCAWEINK